MALKDLFVKSDDDKKPKPGKPPTSAWSEQTKTGSVPGAPKSYLGGTGRRGQGNAAGQTVVPTASGSTTIDPEFSAELEELLGTVPAPKGFDIFLGALDNLAKYIPDEGNRFKAAMETASASGLTVRLIVDTLQAQLQVLQQRLALFQKELEDEANEAVAEREQQLKTLVAQIGELDRQIKKLQEEKQQLSDDQRELQQANAQVEQKKAQVVARFQSAHTALLGKTQGLLEQVRRYLGQ
jgi:regulator of replication initiation timing